MPIPARTRRPRASLHAALAALLLAAAPALAGAPVEPVLTTGPAGTANPDPINQYQPSLGLNYFMPTTGIFPSENRGGFGIGSNPYLGGIRIFAGSSTPIGAQAPEGQLLDIAPNTALFSLLGTSYGGDGETNFALPNLTATASVHQGNGPGLSNWNVGQRRGSATTTLGVNHLPSHNHTFAHPDSPTSNTGGGQSFSNFQPTLATTFWIATQGVFPSENRGGGQFLGQVAQFGGNFATAGWAQADGQILSIVNNEALFSLLGTTYGGDGETTFALPDLRGRVAVHPGQAGGQGNDWQLGERAGSETTTLGINNLPSHNHTLPDLFDGTTNTDNTGNNQAFNNTQPGLGINYLVSLFGLDPNESDPEFTTGPFLGEIIMFAGNFAIPGYALADGQLLPIVGNEDLFSVLGTTYGGDGETTFALPDLRGRTPVHADGSLVTLGQRLGAASTTLTQANLPEHDHTYVPEPSSAALLALAGCTLLRRRRH
ncbi:tail fiber protein [Phycisphaeraceae bacterium D3-23]